MGMPVRIDDTLYEQAKAHASAERRTIAGQIEFWAMVGKAALDNPDLPIDFVRELIARRIARGHVELQETLCDDLAQRLLAHPGVRAVRLSTCKPDVYPDCEAVGVEVFHVKPATAQP